MSVDDAVLAALVERVRRGPARLGPDPAGRLVLVDGPAGSGKTTLAAQLGAALPAQVVHLDDLYEGWTGLLAGVRRLEEDVLAPLAAGADGRYRRYDWHAGAYAETHEVPRAPALVVEGCGAGARRLAPLTTLLVWVEADDALRLERGLRRDGDAARDHWHAWMAQEREVYAAEATRERADVRLDAWGRLLGAGPGFPPAAAAASPGTGGPA